MLIEYADIGLLQAGTLSGKASCLVTKPTAGPNTKGGGLSTGSVLCNM